jgi:hypothetical protein
VNWALPNDTQRGAPQYLAAPPLCMFMCRAFKRHGMVAMAGTQSAPTTTQQMRPNHCVATSHSLSWTVRWRTSRHWHTGRRLTSSTPATHSKSSAAGPRYVRWDRAVTAHEGRGGVLERRSRDDNSLAGFAPGRGQQSGGIQAGPAMLGNRSKQCTTNPFQILDSWSKSLAQSPLTVSETGMRQTN